MSDGKDIVDLGFSRWRSDTFFLGVVAILQVLIGAALVAWVVFDAFTSRRMDSDMRAMGVGFGLIWAGSMGWFLPHCWAFMRSRLLVDAAGVRLDARGRTTYHWAEIEGFDARQPFDVMGLTSVGADMRLRDGRVIPLVLLDHLGGGEDSVRAIAEVTKRVGMMNRLLAKAAMRPRDRGDEHATRGTLTNGPRRSAVERTITAGFWSRLPHGCRSHTPPHRTRSRTDGLSSNDYDRRA